MLCCCMLQGFAHEYTDENGVTWTFDAYYPGTARLTSASNYDTEVVVPEKVSDGTTEYTVDELYTTFRNNTTIEKVTLPQIPIVIYNAFEFCSNLKEVVNSQYITKCTTGAFGATALKTIDLSNCEYVGGFDGSKNLETVILKKCTTIEERAFINCSSLKSLGETSSVKNLGYEAFRGCTNLSKIELPICTNIGSRAFYDCYSLTKIYIPACTTIGESTFYSCGLKEVVLSESITELPSDLFNCCNNLTTINLSNITKISSSAFRYCSSLTKISLPICTSIAQGAFEGCNSLKEINLPICNTIGDAVFVDCNSLTDITLSDKINTIGKDAFGTIEKVTINATKVPSFGGGLYNTIILVPKDALNSYKTADNWKEYAGKILAIGEKTDYDVTTTALDNTPGLLQQLDRDKLNNIVTLKVSGTINGYDIMLFRNKMDNLHHLDLSDADIVANPYEYYEGYCTHDSIIENNAFTNLDKLITVKCPKSVKQIASAFNFCQNLKTIILPEKLEYIGGGGNHGTFFGCTSLTNVVFTKCREIGDYTFYNCKSLQNIDLPEGLTKIGQAAFKDCTSLKEIVIPNGVEAIEQETFSSCSNLRKVSFPPSLKKIKFRSFEYCSSLDSLSLPGLTQIERATFTYCSNLKELKIPSTLESIGGEAFSGCI